jgi:hypothetical protein
MRLPRLLQESQFFLFSSVDEVLAALGSSVSREEREEVARLATLGLPPIASRDCLATMLGVNPGLLWSFEHRPVRHYRIFRIPKGGGNEREIVAPRVALKVVQKWIATCLQRIYTAPKHVFGFVQGHSHIDAAKVHRGAAWTLSVDIENFFSSTPERVVRAALEALGYGESAAEMLARLACFQGVLAQGAPSSPVISNLVLRNVDIKLAELVLKHQCRMSRYADDIVYSGLTQQPDGLLQELEDVFNGTPWRLAPDKIESRRSPERLKVHGLLVHGEQVRLTKGYRNRLRAYAHLLSTGRIEEAQRASIVGHLLYGKQVDAAVD